MIRRVHIRETEVGLRYRRGRFERLLEPGGHWLLGPGLSVERMDARRRLLLVGSQEILTSDSVQIRLSGVVAFRVVDPARALHEVENYEQELYVATQLALRTAVGEATVEDLLEGRLNLGERLTELVAERAPALGIEVFEIDVRDVMLPGEVKTAFAEVLRARAEGRAALERARGESAALRNLANAARLIDGNPALMNLRLLQTIAQDAGAPGTTRFVVNLPETLAPAAANGAADDSETDTR
jgi:regulator of protease activity HflC (stomatin/prohibitin superfamily)